MIRSSVSRRAVPRSIAAGALAVGIAAAAALAVPAAASAGEVSSSIRVMQIHDGWVVDDGAAVVVPVSYGCVRGVPASFKLDVVQSHELGQARGSTVQEVECTGQDTRVDVRVATSNGVSYVRGAGAAAFAWDGAYYTSHTFTPN